MDQPLTFQITLSESFDVAVDKVIETLKAEGFGVLTSVDVKDTFKKKLNVNFRRYVILGACNPQLAYQALQSESLVGLLLPCNVTIEETDEGVIVSIINPEAMLNFPPLLENEKVMEVAAEARQRLERVSKALDVSF